MVPGLQCPTERRGVLPVSVAGDEERFQVSILNQLLQFVPVLATTEAPNCVRTRHGSTHVHGQSQLGRFRLGFGPIRLDNIGTGRHL
jgi:hypothetical protein